MTLVSIILPTYNRAVLISKAIDSVLAQTYQDWELIVWNDGSSDQTEAVVKSYPDPRIQHFYAQNRGMSYGLNQGLQIAKGEYIAFLDDDDEWTPEKLAHQLGILREYDNIDVVFGNYRNINLDTGENGIGFEQSSNALEKLDQQALREEVSLIIGGFFEGICFSNFIAFDTVVARAAALKKAGQFNEALRNGMDFEYWWRLALRGGVFALTNKIVLNRIKYANSLSSPGLATFENSLKSLDSCAQFAIACNRSELLVYLKVPYRNTWQNMMPAYARSGDVPGVLKAFRNSLGYGFRLGTLRLLLESVLRVKQTS